MSQRPKTARVKGPWGRSEGCARTTLAFFGIGIGIGIGFALDFRKTQTAIPIARPIPIATPKKISGLAAGRPYNAGRAMGGQEVRTKLGPGLASHRLRDPWHRGKGPRITPRQCKSNSGPELGSREITVLNYARSMPADQTFALLSTSHFIRIVYRHQTPILKLKG